MNEDVFNVSKEIVLNIDVCRAWSYEVHSASMCLTKRR